MKRHLMAVTLLASCCLVLSVLPGLHAADTLKESVYDTGTLKPTDSRLKVKTGQKAPDFTLVSLSGKQVSLKNFRGRKNVMLSFVPAAWTPVCSDQWPGYNIAREEFEKSNTIILGITVDNIPTLFAWTRAMGDLWFPVLSDFWPHGRTADTYGVLRSSGTTERAIFIIDTQGVIRYIDVHDINKRPPLETILAELEKLSR